MRWLSDREQSEKGVSLIIIALCMFLLLGVAAVAIDLAGLRLDRRADRLASDAAVTAGVAEVNPFAGTGVVEACEAAWDYLLLNLEDEGTPVSPPDCLGQFSGSCDPATPRQATASAPPYSIVITHPIPDTHALMGTQAINTDIDGASCQRLGVTVQRTRQYGFAKVIGFDTGSTIVHSVARSAVEAGSSEVVPLLVLEPIDCAALYTSGQGKVTVSYDSASETPGFIVVDSDASTCGSSNPYSIETQGTQKGWIRAIPVPSPPIPSAILSFAMAGIGSADPFAAYNPGNLTDPVNPADITDPTEPTESWFRLYPEPQAISQRVTRAPLDWRYNCKTGYPDYPLDLSNLSLGGIEILDCPNTSTDGPYIDQHVAAYGTGEPLPVSFQSWLGAGYTCSVGSNIGPLIGDWHIECPGGLIVNGATVTFNDSNIVMDGGIDLRSTAVLSINAGLTNNHFVYIREGTNGTILKRAQASLTLDRTFVYLENGAVDLRAGAGGVTWTAPDDLSYDFDDLALWSEGMLPHEISGQAGNELTGTFFTPFAEPFRLTGQGTQEQFAAQFITRRLELSGTAFVKMIPDPDKTTPIPIRAVKLIR